MTFDPHLATIRFGMGLNPRHALPRDAAALLAEIDADTAYPIAPFAKAKPTALAFQDASRARRKAVDTDGEEAAIEALRDLRRAANTVRDDALRATFARAVEAPTGIAARLTSFWADHFTVRARNGALRHLVTPYIEEAIRPHINGRFSDMLRAVVVHPMMLLYLQQTRSVGENSEIGKRSARGLNENLARELLELHTLGVDGPYTQADVRELANLLTGLNYGAKRGFFFDPRAAEPGAETVMGVRYATQDSLANIMQAVDDLAQHPATARHVAFKIAQFFVSDQPPAPLVDHLTQVFRATQGDLAQVTAALIDHPQAWARALQKVKPPPHFIGSGLRALGVEGIVIARAGTRSTRSVIDRPLRVMGQPWENPVGPDGWPEDSRLWVTAQGMAARINWGMQSPRRIMSGRMPDPRDFVNDALGPYVSQDVVFAAGAAEVRDEGIGIVLSSPAFQRS